MDHVSAISLQRQPLYKQVYDLIARRIVSGELAAGAFLPNEYELSKDLGVSIGTLRKAIDLLVQDGLVLRWQGKGTQVADTYATSMRERLYRLRFGEKHDIRSWSVFNRKVGTVPATGEPARKLGRDGDELLHRIERVRRVDNANCVFEVLYIPQGLMPDLIATDGNEMDAAANAARFGIVIGGHNSRLTARYPSIEAVDALGVDPLSPALRIERLLFSKDNVPIELRISECYLEDGHYLAE